MGTRKLSPCQKLSPCHLSLAPSNRITVQCFISSAGLPSDLADRIINKIIFLDLRISSNERNLFLGFKRGLGRGRV